MEHKEDDKIFTSLIYNIYIQLSLTHNNITKKYQTKNAYFLWSNIVIVLYSIILFAKIQLLSKIIICTLLYLSYLVVFSCCYYRIIKLYDLIKVNSEDLERQLLLVNQQSPENCSEINIPTGEYLNKIIKEKYLTAGMIKYNWLFIAIPTIFYICSMAILFFIAK